MKYLHVEVIEALGHIKARTVAIVEIKPTENDAARNRPPPVAP